jgi:hypothetical protein
MVKVRFFEVEGEPDDVIKVSRAYAGSEQIVTQTATSEHVAPSTLAGAVNGSVITPELVLRVLTRRELSDPIRKELKLLAKAGQKGLTTSELAKAIGIDRGQLAGVNGAFGRRIQNTDGWPSGIGIIEKYRDENHVKRLRVPDVVRAALEKFSL